MSWSRVTSRSIGMWSLGVMMLILSGCGGDSSEPASEPDLASAVASSASGPTTTVNVEAPAETTIPVPSDPFALTGPVDVRIEGTCTPTVFRDDETGTTWLLRCFLGRGTDASLHPAVRSTEYATHFRYVSDTDGELVAVSLSAPAVFNRLCQWTAVAFDLGDYPIVDDEITFAGTLDDTGSCDGLSWSYTITWNVDTNTVAMEGVLAPGTS